MTSESVQQREPVFVAGTKKSAEVYTNCVHERWAELAVGAERFTRPEATESATMPVELWT
jgi:hypothetical protein